VVRNDGTYEIYRIQHKYNKKGAWAYSGVTDGSFAADIPVKHRYVNVHDHKMTPAFYAFSACGEVWQKTGIHGSFNRGDALKVLKLMAEYNPEHKFRVVKVTITQKTEEVALMDYSIANVS
jgi:hypothetical protein